MLVHLTLEVLTTLAQAKHKNRLHFFHHYPPLHRRIFLSSLNTGESLVAAGGAHNDPPRLTIFS